MTAEYTLFSNVPGTFTKIDHMYVHNISLNVHESLKSYRVYSWPKWNQNRKSQNTKYKILKSLLKTHPSTWQWEPTARTSLGAQWLRLLASTAGSLVREVPHAQQCSQKQNKKTLLNNHLSIAKLGIIFNWMIKI